MDVPSVPASVTAVIASGKLPPEFAAFFTAAGELTDGTDWSDVASAVDEYLAAGGLDEDVRGALALAGAYGRLDTLEDCPDPDAMDEGQRPGHRATTGSRSQRRRRGRDL